MYLIPFAIPSSFKLPFLIFWNFSPDFFLSAHLSHHPQILSVPCGFLPQFSFNPLLCNISEYFILVTSAITCMWAVPEWYTFYLDLFFLLFLSRCPSPCWTATPECHTSVPDSTATRTSAALLPLLHLFLLPSYSPRRRALRAEGAAKAELGFTLTFCSPLTPSPYPRGYQAPHFCGVPYF